MGPVLEMVYKNKTKVNEESMIIIVSMDSKLTLHVAGRKLIFLVIIR